MIQFVLIKKIIVFLTFVFLSLLLLSNNSYAATSSRTTSLFSKNINGGIPNGVSRNPAISHDQRIARVMAYESDASDIVSGDTNGSTDIFMVKRGGAWGNNGTPWETGSTILISNGIGNVPSNGPSTSPIIDGDSHNKPKCIAFLSAASNLITGDTNNQTDAFVYFIPTGSIKRVSLNNKGKQLSGKTTHIGIDGDCERVAFTTNNRVYIRIIDAKKIHEKEFIGDTLPISNGTEIYLARSGKAVTYTNGGQIYRTSIKRKYVRNKKGKGRQQLLLNKELISTNSKDKKGNGPSSHPSITDDGRYIAFETFANNILPGDNNGVSDVVRVDLKNPKKPRISNASKSIDGIANGASNNPVISDAGEFILYDSDATNLRPSTDVIFDPNNVRDVFLWNAPTGHVSLESRNWNNKYIYSGRSYSPVTSSRGNYVLFESMATDLDSSIVNRSELSQVYLRYLGPQ